MILGIDAGNSNVKVCSDYGLLQFNSTLGESRELNLQQVHGLDDMVWEYEGQKGFAGSLAFYESEFSGSIMGDTKVHQDTKIRVLLAIHRYCTTYNINETHFDIIIGQPIATHNQNEKEKLKNMLKGNHTITVNGIEKTFIINKIEVAAECASAYWSNPQKGLTRIIDVGSGTVNYATILDGRYIDKDSDTIPFGINTNKTNDLKSLVRGVVTHLYKKWDKNNQVFIIGGIAKEIQPYFKEYFPFVKILYPIFNRQYVDPIFANAISFYTIAVNLYE